MKKLIYALVLILCSLTVSVSAQENYELYKNLGIEIPNDVAEPIIRGDFASTAASIIPNKELYTDTEIPFYDVSKESTYHDAVAVLYANKAIYGTSSNLYSPERYITSNEACAIMVRILGCEYMVKDGNYIAAANTIGLLDGVVVNDDGTIPASSARRMLYNALETDITIYIPNIITNSNNSKEAKTYLEERFGIKKMYGLVSDNGKTSLYGSTQVSEEYIIIAGETFINESGLDYLGYIVDAWYTDDNGDYTLKYMRPRYDDVSVEFNVHDIKSFENNYYQVYVKENRTKKYNLADNYRLIYNSRAYNGAFDSTEFAKMMIPEIGSVRLIDSDNDRKYDIVVIKSYETYVVSGIIESTQTIIDKIDQTRKISLKDVDELDIKASTGAERAFNNILKDSIVSIAMSADKSYAEIIISSQTVKGESLAFGDDKITIDDKEYYMTPEYEKHLEALLERNPKKLTFMLDFEGNIAYHDISTDGLNIAYLINYYRDDAGDGTIIKIHTSNNEQLRLTLADRVVIDGTTVKGGNIASKIASLPYSKHCLISYKVNEDNLVTNIDFPYYGTNNSSAESLETLHIAEGLNDVKKKLKSDSLGEGMALTSDTLIWIIPENEDEINVVKSYSTAAGSYTPSLTLTAYTTEEYPLSVPWVVASGKKSAGIDLNIESYTSNVRAYVVKDISKEYRNDMIVNKITLSDGGQYLDFYTSYESDPVCMKSGAKVRVGDLIKYGTDKAGYIPEGQIVVLYSPHDDVDGFEGIKYTNGDLSSQKSASGENTTGIMYGWVNTKTDKFIEIGIQTDPRKENITFSNRTVLSTGSLAIVTYDKSLTKRHSVQNGTSDDILAYRDSGVASKILLDWCNGSIRTVYVIKEE